MARKSDQNRRIQPICCLQSVYNCEDGELCWDKNERNIDEAWNLSFNLPRSHSFEWWIYFSFIHFGYTIFGTEWAQVSFQKASSYSREILLKFCSIRSVCFHFTAYYVDITFKIFHNVTRRQIQIRKRQTVQKCPSQIASISFSTIFWQLSIKKAELTQKAGKSQHFSILIKTSKSWKKTREMYCFDFFAISEIQR